MRKIEIYKDGVIDDTLEVSDDDFATKMHLARLTAEVKSRDEGIEYKATEYQEPVPEKKLTKEEEKEIAIQNKMQEILRRQAIEEIEAEKSIEK